MPGTIERLAYAYPATGSTMTQKVSLTFPADPPTLFPPDILGAIFDPNPGECDECEKPHCHIPSRPNHSFTIISSCVHDPDLQDPDVHPPNPAIKRMVSTTLHPYLPLGHVVVFKHILKTNPDISNRHLHVVNVEDDDIPLIDELVARWVAELRSRKLGRTPHGPAAWPGVVPVVPPA
ncbi:hypothetical protein R3P38DRAFT_3175446 [Favolaschia claudopus]|uniref:Uncharacterized protein n=1 Tax=Favolaschia claudopus TaxID=2862362 RepID=A0AAW0DER3_9AGAR